jgi:hypothetical protein
MDDPARLVAKPPFRRDGRNMLEKACARLAGRVSFDQRNGCYRLDGRPVRIQELIQLYGEMTPAR